MCAPARGKGDENAKVEPDPDRRRSGREGDYAEGRATRTGESILDGWAIQDTWVSEKPDGSKFMGINIRNRWLPQGTLQWKYFEARQAGDTMVTTGGEVFYGIEKDRWSWRKDRSYDGGKTWVEGIGFIDATRG